MKRIFTAIDISEEARRRVSDYVENLRGEFPKPRVGWEQAEKLHLTLKFLGDANDEQIEKLTVSIEKIAAEISSFALRVSGVGIFPSARNARILWLGLIDESKSLLKLNELLESECERIGFPREKRSFKPHLTVARLREPAKSVELVKTHLQSDFPRVGFGVEEIIIYQSRLLPRGSLYTPLVKKKLR